MVVETDHPTLGRLRTLGSPIKMSGTPPDVSHRAPLLGEHPDQVPTEAGYNEREIAAPRQSGAVRQRPHVAVSFKGNSGVFNYTDTAARATIR